MSTKEVERNAVINAVVERRLKQSEAIHFSGYRDGKSFALLSATGKQVRKGSSQNIVDASATTATAKTQNKK